MPVMKPYKLASREFVADPTVVRLGDAADTAIGGPELAVIAGPCSVEGWEMLRGDGEAVKAAGAGLLRGGAFKPRTSPYAFQGLGDEALRMLARVRPRRGCRWSRR
jgi:3-deoxy-7-phosphoheptulonate synthase